MQRNEAVLLAEIDARTPHETTWGPVLWAHRYYTALWAKSLNLVSKCNLIFNWVRFWEKAHSQAN